jgi:hypothetical protein
MKVKIVALVAPLLLSAVTTASAAPPAAKHPELVDVQSANCAQFAQALNYAKLPAKPTKKQKETAALAQDDIILALTWMNGYLAGRDPAKGAPAFEKEWIVSSIGKLSEICKANSGAMLLRDAAAKL